MADVPSAVLTEDAELDALIEELEKGAPPAPEAVSAEPEGLPEATPQGDTGKDGEGLDEGNLKVELERAKHRYATLQGMMKADATRQTQIIEELREQVRQNQAAQVDTPIDVSQILTEDERQELGEAGVEGLRKLAAAIAAKEVSKAKMEVDAAMEEMRKRVAAAEASAGGNTIWDKVDQINPGAKQINSSDVGWFAFLQQIDPVSGIPYRDLGEAAASIGDIQRLSGLIDLYRRYADLKPKVAAKPDQVRAAPTIDGKGQSTGQPKIYTQDEVRAFYDARARGINYKGLGKKQLDALEADIDAAMEEGRIRL